VRERKRERERRRWEVREIEEGGTKGDKRTKRGEGKEREKEKDGERERGREDLKEEGKGHWQIFSLTFSSQNTKE
jgi:hypothetical protein